MKIDTNQAMQQLQMRKMDGSGGGQGNGGMGKMMRENLAMLPDETQGEIKSLMQTLDPRAKQDTMTQMALIETSNMTVEDLTKAIMDMFNPTAEAEASSFPASFSAYA